MFAQILILILGFALLISGADFLVKGASGIAKKFHISEILIGLTIVSLGTSLPELVITIISSATGSNDIVVGNVIGSNICNLLLVLAVSAILKPIKFEKSSTKQNLPLLIMLTLLVLIMGLGIFSTSKLTITKFDGIILLIIAIVYFAIPIRTYFKEIKNSDSHIDETNEELNKSRSIIIKYIIYMILGGFALKYGGDFVVDSATNIAHIFNLSERVIGLTIVALGTSLPELVTSVVAILKGDDDIAEGNIIGSCIINFCLILGIGATISNLPISAAYIENLILLLGSSILIWLYGIGNKDNTLKRSNGVILLIIYIIYNIRLFI